DDSRAVVLEAVADGRAVFTLRVPVAGDELVAERLRRPSGVARGLRAEERAAVVVPRDHGVPGPRRASLRERCERRRVVGVARDERARPRSAAGHRPVVAEPHWPDRAGRRTPVVDAAVVVGAAEQDVRVARVELYGGLVLAAVRDRALVERLVGVRIAGSEGVRADVAGTAT